MALLYDFSDAPMAFMLQVVKPWVEANYIDPSRLPMKGTICIDGNEISGFHFTEPRVVEQHTGTFAKEPFTTPLVTAPPPNFVPYLRTAAKR